MLTNAVGEQFRNAQNAQKLEPLGSWTAFMKQVTQHETKKAVLKNLPVLPLPPSDNICKWYLGKMTEMVEDLKYNCIFLHANEAVYCKMMMIKWLNQGQYDKIIPLLGGFHMLFVKLKILIKHVVSLV